MYDVRAIIRRNEGGADANNLAVLSRLVRRAEITKALYARYDSDFRAIKESGPLSESDIETMIAVILRAGPDLVTLNGLFKMADGVLGTPSFHASQGLMCDLIDNLNARSLS